MMQHIKTQTSRHLLFTHMSPSVELFDQPCEKDGVSQYRLDQQFSPFGAFLINYEPEMEFFPPELVLHLYPHVLEKFPCLAQYMNIINELESLTQNHDFWLAKKFNLQSFYKQHILI